MFGLKDKNSVSLVSEKVTNAEYSYITNDLNYVLDINSDGITDDADMQIIWKYFIYYHEDTPVAFTEFKVFDNKHVLSGQFAWDYENPKLGLGTYATLYEIDWSYKNKYKNYYLSYGYETTSKYKSKYKGFEFWNGKEWVNNKSMYNKLCDNDSSIESIKDLNKYQREYFKLNA